jgi:hypothetical protein
VAKDDSWGLAAAAGVAPSSSYYEPVAPSTWKPEEKDDFLDLYKR